PSDETAGSSVASPSANRNAAPGAPQSNSRNTTSRNTTSGSASSGKVSTEQIKSANKPVPGARPRPVNPVTVAQNQFQLDKLGSDRRWSFQLAGLGSVVYLEKSGLKYLVLFDRGIYFEAGAADLGFEAGRILNPVLAAQKCASRSQSEGLGSQQVAGRTSFGFRFAPAAGSSGATPVIVCVDQATRLPTRFETRDLSRDGPPKSLIEASQLKLNPPQSLFDVPSGMKKVNTDNARTYIQAFVAGVQPFVEAMNAGQSIKSQSASSDAR